MHKKTLFIILSIILSLSILMVGCIPESPSTNDDEPVTTPEIEETTPEPVVVVEPDSENITEEPVNITPVSTPIDIHDRPGELLEKIEVGPICGDGNIDEEKGEECDIGGARDSEGRLYPSYKDTCKGEEACNNCACKLESCEGIGIFDNDDCTDNCTGNQLCVQKGAKSRCYKCYDKCPVGNFVNDNDCDDSCGTNEHCQKDPVETECYFCMERCPGGQYFADGTCGGECSSSTSCKPADKTSCYYCATA